MAEFERELWAEFKRLEEEARRVVEEIGVSLDELPEETTADMPADLLLIEACKLTPRKTARPSVAPRS